MGKTRFLKWVKHFRTFYAYFYSKVGLIRKIYPSGILGVAMWQCRRATGKTWGLKPKVVYWIYTSIIRPILTYSSFLWWKKTTQVSTTKKLAHLQRLGCIGITIVMRSTPTAALEVALILQPLNLFIEKEAMRTTLRLQIILAPSDRIIATRVFDRKFLTKFPTKDS
jgi:hypothetical protein